MPLLDFWKSNPAAVEQLAIAQVVATAGDGILKDNSDCSVELRDFLSNINSQKIAIYVDQCLSSKYERGGMILQDLVNELGRRLDFKVQNGRYNGTVNAIGYDGVWQASEGNAIVVEVKTSDAYRISLDTLARYRDGLTAQGSLPADSSILIVVGRQDTGELEAQIRGSRHAWSIRLISVESLIKIVRLKESSDDTETGFKIRSILTPVEYTRLDRLVDVMFTTATDVLSTKVVEPERIDAAPPPVAMPPSRSLDDPKAKAWEFTDSSVLAAKRQAIVEAFGRSLGVNFIAKSRALYWNKEHNKRVACTVSKRYEAKSSVPYWYAHHPKWNSFLLEGESGYLVLGCMDLDHAFAVPISDFKTIMPQLNVTTRGDSSYWHIHLTYSKSQEMEIVVPRAASNFSLKDYKFEMAS